MSGSTINSVTSPGPVAWDLVDNLGSVRDIADNSGAPADHVVYSSFGQVAYEAAPTASTSPASRAATSIQTLAK